MANRFGTSTCDSRDQLWAAYHQAVRAPACITATFAGNGENALDGQTQVRMLLTSIARHCITCGCDPQWTVHLGSSLPSA